jgi:hypothetical protein
MRYEKKHKESNTKATCSKHGHNHHRGQGQMEVVTKNRSKIRYNRRSKFAPTRTAFRRQTSLYAKPNANAALSKNDTVTGILDLLDYSRKIAWLMHTNRQGMFKFSDEFIEPLRRLWGLKVKCVIDPNNELVQINDARRRPKETSKQFEWRPSGDVKV